MEDKIIAYKGMDSKMQCRGMQYAVGKEFSVDGKTVKADTWYRLKNGELMEAGDGE